MTHTLHRCGDPADLRQDYVLLAMAARGFYEDADARQQRVWEILSRFGDRLANYGNVTHGTKGDVTFSELRTVRSRLVHAVFTDRETLDACIRALAEADVGVSVVVSGIYEDVLETCEGAGLAPHTVNLSLGIHGRTDRLPPEGVLEITTMCGHAMVAGTLVAKVIDDIERGRRTHAEGAAELSRLCVCGIFNPVRAEAVLRRMTGPAPEAPGDAETR